MAKSSYYKKSIWSEPKKLISILAVIAVSVATLTLANYGFQHFFSLRSQAAIGNATLSFEPSAVSLSGNAKVNLNAWVYVDQAVDKLELIYTFDQTKIALTGDIAFPVDTPFIYRNNQTPLNEANKTGRGIITLSMTPPTTSTPAPTSNDVVKVKGVATYAAATPGTRTTPPKPIYTSGPTYTSVPYPSHTADPASPPYAPPGIVLPVGNIKLATFQVRVLKPIIDKTTFSFDFKNSKIVGGDGILFNTTASSAALFLNQAVVTPAPSQFSPPPSAQVCAQETGACKTKSGACEKYTNSCQKTDMCATPFTHCSISNPPTSTPPIADLYGCSVQVYKLKPTDNLTNTNLLITPDRRVDPSTNRVAPGERYLYEIEAINNSLTDARPSTISAVTSNVRGYDEPIVIRATSRSCTPEARAKFMSCNQRSLIIPAKSSKLTDINMVVEIQKDVVSSINTSTLFNLHYIFGNVGYSAQCGVLMLAAEQVTPPPGCYYKKPTVCLKKIYGATCEDTLVCPTTPPKPSLPARTSPPRRTPKPAPTLPPNPTKCIKIINNWICLPPPRN